MGEYQRQDKWRAELIVNGISYGLWNRDEATFGSDSTSVTDPEDGPQPNGGRQTAEAVGINRPWKVSRDEPVYKVLKPIRGRNVAQLIIHALDDFGQPTSSQPVDTLNGVLTEIKIPPGDADANDNSAITASLDIKP